VAPFQQPKLHRSSLPEMILEVLGCHVRPSCACAAEGFIPSSHDFELGPHEDVLSPMVISRIRSLVIAQPVHESLVSCHSCGCVRLMLPGVGQEFRRSWVAIA